MSVDHLAAWRWWSEPDNQPDILAHPDPGGGLAAYRNQHGDLVLMQHDYHQDENAMLMLSRHLVRPLIEKLLELYPELTEQPKPPLLLPPPRQIAITPASSSHRRRAGELPLAGRAAE